MISWKVTSSSFGAIRKYGKMAYIVETGSPMSHQARLRLRAQDHRVFFRDKGDYLEISRVLDRKEAYR
jgi:hypothetical protein